MLKRLASHFSWYTLGSLVATLASFISFPLLTRVFTVEEYGILNLIAVALLLLVGLAKSGLQHAVVRFYGEVVSGRHPKDRLMFHSTVFYGMAITGLVVTLVWLPVSQVLPDNIWRDSRVRALLIITASLVLTRSMDSAVVNLLRAQERSAALSVYQVAKKYLLLAGTVVSLWVLSGGLTAYYVAILVTEVAALSGIVYYMFRDEGCRPQNFDAGLFRAMMAFGIPMIGYETMGIVLNAGSRYIVGWFQGNGAVGIYSAAYNLCEYVDGIVVLSVAQAVQPMYVRIWKNNGPEATSRFLEQAMHLYIAVGAVVAAGVSAVGEELISLLASEKYADSNSVVPLVICGMVVRGSMVIFGAGIYLQMQPRLIASVVAITAVVNVTLNILLVPIWGIHGAALAMLVSYVAQSAIVYIFGTRRLSVVMPWRILVMYTAIGTIMYLCVERIDIGNHWGDLGTKMAVGAVVFAMLALVFDKLARKVAITGLSWLRARANHA